MNTVKKIKKIKSVNKMLAILLIYEKKGAHLYTTIKWGSCLGSKVDSLFKM